jgi:hypothetical protein
VGSTPPAKNLNDEEVLTIYQALPAPPAARKFGHAPGRRTL